MTSGKAGSAGDFSSALAGSKEKLRRRMPVLLVAASLLFAGCAGMSNTEQRVLSGGAIGASGGAILGAIGGSAALGAAAGGGAGLLGGFVYDQYQKSRGNP